MTKPLHAGKAAQNGYLAATLAARGLSVVVVDALLFAYVLGIVPALLIGGPLSDRLGRRPLMLPAPLFAAVGSGLLAAGSESVALLTAGRVCSGIALGLSMAVGGSWIKELSDRDGAQTALVTASKKLDKAVSKGVLHANQAANKKSALAKRVNKI